MGPPNAVFSVRQKTAQNIKKNPANVLARPPQALHLCCLANRHGSAASGPNGGATSFPRVPTRQRAGCKPNPGRENVQHPAALLRASPKAPAFWRLTLGRGPWDGSITTVMSSALFDVAETAPRPKHPSPNAGDLRPFPFERAGSTPRCLPKGHQSSPERQWLKAMCVSAATAPAIYPVNSARPA